MRMQWEAATLGAQHVSENFGVYLPGVIELKTLFCRSIASYHQVLAVAPLRPCSLLRLALSTVSANPV